MTGDVPTPARQAFLGDDQESDVDAESERTVEIDGRVWRITVIGQAQVGRRSVAKVPLLHLAIEAVDGATAHEVLVPCRSLGGLADLQLEELIRSRANPV